MIHGAPLSQSSLLGHDWVRPSSVVMSWPTWGASTPMGLLDSLVSSALQGMLSGQQSQALPGMLSQILGQTNLGGMGGLLAQLQRAGLDRQVASWLGNG